MAEKYFIQDVKPRAADQPKIPTPASSLPYLKRVVRKRLGSTYDDKSLAAVRLLDSNGNEIYRWDWGNEDQRRQKISRRRSRERARKRKAAKHA